MGHKFKIVQPIFDFSSNGVVLKCPIKDGSFRERGTPLYTSSIRMRLT